MALRPAVQRAVQPPMHFACVPAAESGRWQGATSAASRESNATQQDSRAKPR